MKDFAPAVGLALLVSTAAYGGDEFKQAIVDRCTAAVGEYGEAMVDMCVKRDLVAVAELLAYPEEHRPIVIQCRDKMLSYGWSMVKTCADERLESDAAD